MNLRRAKKHGSPRSLVYSNVAKASLWTYPADGQTWRELAQFPFHFPCSFPYDSPLFGGNQRCFQNCLLSEGYTDLRASLARAGCIIPVSYMDSLGAFYHGPLNFQGAEMGS